MSLPVQGGPPRLTPAMSSRRLQVLDFVRDYIASHNASPSEYEIAAGVGISRPRARELLKALVKAGQLKRRPGPRGLMLPSAIEEAKRRLRDHGYTVDEDLLAAAPRPKTTLQPLPALDYHPDGTNGGGGGDETGEQGWARTREGP